MITPTVRYKLPPHIGYAVCRGHFHEIAPGFREARGGSSPRTAIPAWTRWSAFNTASPARSGINYLFELPWHDLSWLGRGLKLSEFQSQCTAFDNAGVTAKHPKLCLLTITPEVNI